MSLNTKNSIFGLYPQFLREKKFFQENVALSGTISYGFLALNQNSEKSNDRKKNGQTLLHKTPPATAGDLTSTTALE